MRVFGLLPAAGKSRRMGRPKLLLPLAGRTILDAVVRAVIDGGADEVLVVSAPNDQDLVSAATSAGASVVQLSSDTPDMQATCQAGLRWIARFRQPSNDDAFLLLPADHPTLSAEAPAALIEAAQRDRSASIFVPAFQGKRGHPTLFRWRHADAIMQIPENTGINRYVRERETEVRCLAWPDASVVRDMDTPEDYSRLMEGAEKKETGA